MTKKKCVGTLVLDVLMVLAFAILFNKSAFGTLAFHEITGLCFAGALVAHIVLKHKQMAGMGQKFGAMPTKMKVEFILMWALLADLAVMTVTGVLISKVVFAKLITAQFNVQGLHTATAYLALLLMGLHIGLAWDHVLALCRGTFGAGKKSGTADAVLRVVAVVIFAFGVYSMVTTNYFAKAFNFSGGGHEEHQMMPGGFDGPQGQGGQGDQSTQSSQGDQSTQSDQSGQDSQSTQTSPDSQTAQSGQSETSGGAVVTTASTLSYARLDTSSGAATDGTDDSSLTGGGKTGGGPGKGGQMPNGQVPHDGQMPDNGQTPTDDQMPDNGQTPTDGQMPDNGQMPTDGQMPGGGQMNGGSTAKTAAAELSILGAFAVLAYYLSKLLGGKKKKTSPAVEQSVETAEPAAVPETGEPTDEAVETESEPADAAEAAQTPSGTSDASNEARDADEAPKP